MCGIFKVVFFLGFLYFVFGEKVKYDGYRVVRIIPRTEKELETLQQLEEDGVQYWERPSRIGRGVDIMFPPGLQYKIENLQRNGIRVEPFIQDVQSLIDDTARVMTNRGSRMTWDNYYTNDEINAFLQEQAMAHPDIASLQSIGKSTEGRDLTVIKISKSGGGTKPVIFVDASEAHGLIYIHAREWITSAVATYLINELLNGNNEEVKQWSQDFDWHILPMVNPDGFVYTHNTNRMWRKTRSPVNGSSCLGTDANRNFGFHWMEGGASANPCTETFAGSEPFSEPESKAVKAYLDGIAPRMVFYLSLHSYSQVILLPYSYNGQHVEQHDYIMDLARQAVIRHAGRYGTQFEFGNTADVLYPCSGTTMDYVQGELKTPLVLSYELRDTGTYGFLLPANQILPSCLEFMDGFGVYLTALKNPKPRLQIKQQII